MKTLGTALFLLVVLAATGCKNQYLTGYMTKDDFVRQCKWKHTADYKYKPRFPEYADSLRTLRDSVDATIVLGTWCSDSRRWVRRFFALQASLPIRKLEIVGVDTTKKDIRGYYKTYDYDSIPVFIFKRKDKEIGRIYVKPQKPKRSIERDLWRIMKP